MFGQEHKVAVNITNYANRDEAAISDLTALPAILNLGS